MRYVVAAAVLLFALQASAQERRIVYDFVGFSEDGETFLVKKYDYNVGWSFDVRSIHDGTRAERVPFDEGTEDKVLKRLQRKYKLKDGTSPKSPDERFVVLGAVDGKYLDVLVMEKEAAKVGRFQDIPLKEDKGKKALGEGLLKKAVWSPDGTHVVAIAELKSPDGAFQEDEVFSWKFRSWKVKWFRGKDDAGGAAKPEEKD